MIDRWSYIVLLLLQMTQGSLWICM